MGDLLGGGSSNAPEKLFGARVNQSILGLVFPWGMGTFQVQQNMLWVDGWVATEQSSGGKGGSGGGKGGGGKSGGDYYTYSADVVSGLCIGPVLGIGDAWSSQSWLGSPTAAESYTISSGSSYAYTPTNASSLKNDMGVGLSTSYSYSQQDIGAPSTTSVSGTHLVAMQKLSYGSTLTTGTYSINPSGNVYNFSPADNGKSVQIGYSYTLTNITQQESDIVPSSGNIALGGTFQFAGLASVVYGPGEALEGQAVGSANYSVSGSGPATINFASGIHGHLVVITYYIVDSAAVGQNQPTQLNFTLATGGTGQTPYSFLTSTFPGAAVSYPGVATLLYQPMAFGASGEAQQNKFEVISHGVYGGVYTKGQAADVGQPIEDCNPVYCIYQVLTNTQTGLGQAGIPFPTAAIDSGPFGTWGNGTNSAANAGVTSSGNCGTGAGTGWTTPSGIVGSSGYAEVGTLLGEGGGNLNPLKGTNFGLSVPSGNTINGVTVTFQAGTVGLFAAEVATIQLVYNGSTIGYPKTINLPLKDNQSNIPFGNFTAGSPNDSWGASLTPAICNSSTFGYQVVFYTNPGLIIGILGVRNYTVQVASYVASTSGTPTQDNTAWGWFAANGYFISPLMDNQDSAATNIGNWLEDGMCASYFSEGLLKLVPYGDTTTDGNGCIWTAPTAYVVALDDTCYMPAGEGEDPVEIERSPYADAMNVVQIQWENRTHQYSPEITSESNQGSINSWGTRKEDPRDSDYIKTLTAATFAANMRVKHGTYVRNQYKFKLPYTYSYLEPMDLITISTTSAWALGLNNVNLGMVNNPVRILKIVDDGEKGLSITCEDYPWGAHLPVLYNKGISSADVLVNMFADPGNAEAVLFEATSRMTQGKGNQIWIGVNGAGADYGYCNVWCDLLSGGSKYTQIATIKQQARLGVLYSAFASGSDPDTTNSLVVTMAENCGALDVGTDTDADLGNTACMVDGEIISYSACAVTGQNTYTMNGYIRRGMYNSPVGSHSAGTLFLRLDGSVFKFQYDPAWAGQTVNFKFQAVNSFGLNAQSLSSLTPVSFVIPGNNPGTIEAGSGLVLQENYKGTGYGPLAWTPIATTTDSTINYGNDGYSGQAALPSGVNTSYFYTRWTGYIVPSVTGEYTIGVNSDDGANLYLAGSQVGTDNLPTQRAAAGNLTYSSGSSATALLTAGVYYPIVIEWENGATPYAIQLIWTTPKFGGSGGVTQLIPSGNLSTSHTSVTGNLAGTWWNGSSGLWFPSGTGLVDTANTTLYGPPQAGGGTNLRQCCRFCHRNSKQSAGQPKHLHRSKQRRSVDQGSGVVKRGNR